MQSSIFSMYSMQYYVETVGVELYLVVINIELDVTFRLPILIINSIRVVIDYLTGIEYAIIQNTDGNLVLMQSWTDDINVIVEYQSQFAYVTYTQQTYNFISVEWVSVCLFG